MGEWLYRKALDHTCNRPKDATGVTTGDIWRCECGLIWQVTKNSDQRGGTWLTWTRFTGMVPEQKTGYAVNKLGEDTSGIYAPGTK